jgi:DNA polymerase (family 10)
MTNADVARIFSQMAIMLELDLANSFRVRAYREAARQVESLGEPLTAVFAREGGLEEIPGIGKDLAQKIRDIVATGTTQMYEDLKGKYPLEMVRLTELQGLGAKRVRQMFDRLGVRDRDTLEAAARAGKLRELPGFGEKMEAKILNSLAVSSQFTGRLLLSGAWAIAHALSDSLRAIPGVEQVEIAGSFRRRKDTIGDLDLLVCGGSPAAVMDVFVSNPQVAEVLGHGDTKSSVRLANGLQVDLRVVPEDSFGAALLYFTGSKAHNIELRRIAIDNGMSLNEYGLTRDGQRVAGRIEEEVYRALNLAWVPPELREAQGEIAMARDGTLPVLIEAEDLRGDLHMHTTRSDGRGTLEEMVRACRDRGYAYCAITEHSQSLVIANGFDEDRVRQSVAEIAAVRRQVPGIEVLHGLEVDILADGALDLGDDALALLDWVTVSLHARLDQPRDEVTARVLRAIEHPATSALSHPTGRIIGNRAGAALDFDRVFERAAALGVAVEINAQPDRMDLSDAHARRAKELGVTLVIDTDAHSVASLDYIRYGLFAARRAGLTKHDVINALPFDRFLERRRQRPGAAAATTIPVGGMEPAPAAEAPPASAGRAAKPGAARRGRPGTERIDKPKPSATAKKVARKSKARP